MTAQAQLLHYADSTAKSQWARARSQKGSSPVSRVNLDEGKQRNFLFREECVALAPDDEGNEKVQSCTPYQIYTRNLTRFQKETPEKRDKSQNAWLLLNTTDRFLATEVLLREAIEKDVREGV